MSAQSARRYNSPGRPRSAGGSRGQLQTRNSFQDQRTNKDKYTRAKEEGWNGVLNDRWPKKTISTVSPKLARGMSFQLDDPATSWDNPEVIGGDDASIEDAGVPMVPVCAPKCEAVGDVSVVFVGDVASLLINSKDYNGQPLTTGGAMFTCKLRGPSTPVTSIEDMGDGTYTVSFRSTVTGSYRLSVMLENIHIQGSPFEVKVMQAFAHAPKCSASGAGIYSAIAGEQATFTIQARSVDGLERRVGGQPFEASLYLTGDGTETPADVFDVGDGSYNASYTVVRAGFWSLSVTSQGKHVMGSPFGVVVEPAMTKAECSEAFGEGLVASIAGMSAEFAIQAKDEYGNKQIKGGNTWKVKMFAADGSNDTDILSMAGEGTVMDNLDGTYVTRYTNTVAGVYTLHVTLDDRHIVGSPFRVATSPGPTFAPKCYATGPGKESAVCGEPAPFFIHAIDEFDNKRDFYGDEYEVTALARGQQMVRMAAEEHPEEVGVYVVDQVWQIAGDYSVSITLKGTLIQDCPFTLRVEPAATDPATCLVSGDALTQVVAGDTGSFIISARDRFGNSSARGVDEFTVYLEGPPCDDRPMDDHSTTSRVVYSTGNTLVYVNGVVTYESNNMYIARYRTTVAGEYQLHIKMGPDHVMESPHTLTVLPSATDASTTVCSGEALFLAIAGEPHSFLIRARDRYHNPAIVQLPRKPDEFVIQLSGPVSVGGSVDFVKDALYNGAYVPKVVGTYALSILLNGDHTVGSPFQLTVTPGFTHAPSCYFIESDKSLYGQAVSTAKTSTFTVQACDKCGNKRTEGGDVFSVLVTVTTEDRQVIEVPVVLTDNEDGTYTAIFSRERSGMQRVEVQLDKVHIAGSPVEAAIKPGRANHLKSTAHGPGLETAVVGERASFSIQARDQFGNKCSGGGEPLRASVRGPSPTMCKVLDHKDGTYTATYVMHLSGLYNIDVKLDRSGIVDSPFLCRVASVEESVRAKG